MEPAAAAPAQRFADPTADDRALAAAAAAEGGRSPDPALSAAALSGGNGGAAREEAPCEAPPGPLPGRAGGTGRRRRRGAPQPAAAGVAPVPAAGGANSLLLKRGRLKRNLSAAASSSSSPSSASSSAAGGLPASCSASASLCTRSLDRKTLLLKHRQLLQLQPSDRDWVRHQLQRGCVHVFDRHMASSYLRPVLCTLDTTAAEVAARLLQLGHKGGGVVKVLGHGPPPAAAVPPAASEQSRDAELGRDVEPPPSDSPDGAARGPARAPPADLPLPGGAWTRCAPRVSPVPSDSSPGELFAGSSGSPPSSQRPTSDTESFSLSPSAESVSDRLDPYSSGGGSSSSSEELEADPATVLTGPSGRPAQPLPKTSALPQLKASTGVDGTGAMAGEGPRDATPGRIRETVQKTSSPPSLYVQLRGETTRRLEADEKPLQIQNDYLFQLGFGELWRVQEEGMDSEIGSLIRFYAGKEVSCLHVSVWLRTLAGIDKSFEGAGAVVVVSLL